MGCEFDARCCEFGYYGREWETAKSNQNSFQSGYATLSFSLHRYELTACGNWSVFPYFFSAATSPFAFPQIYSAARLSYIFPQKYNTCINTHVFPYCYSIISAHVIPHAYTTVSNNGVHVYPFGTFNASVWPHPLVTGSANQSVFPASIAMGTFDVSPMPLSGVWVASVYKHDGGKFNTSIFPFRYPADVWNRNVFPHPVISNPVTCHTVFPHPMTPPGINSKNIFPYPTRTKLPVIHDHEYDIFLDGKSIKHLLIASEVIHREDALHNEVSLQCISPDIYRNLDPEENKGELRIKVITDGNEEEFLLEDKDGIPLDFVIYGVSASAKYDSNHSYIEYSANNGTMMSVIADELVPGIVWNAEDWVIEDEFTWDGAAIQGVKRLADAIKALVECDPDGNIIVRNLYPVRPIEMQSADYEIALDRSKITDASKSFQRGNGYNAIDVLGPTADDNFDINIDVVSDPAPVIGEDAIIRVYYPTPKEPENIEMSVSAGMIERNGIHEVLIKEQISFDAGQGDASFPVVSIEVVEWIGSNGGDITFFPYFRYLRCEEDYGLANVAYKTKYHQYRCFGGNVSEVIGKLLIPVPGGNDITVFIGDGDAINPEAITDDLLISEPAKKARGEAEIDSNYYDRDIVTINVFYHPEIIPGKLILIDNQIDDISGIYKVVSSARKYSGPLITTSVECEKCHI